MKASTIASSLLKTVMISLIFLVFTTQGKAQITSAGDIAITSLNTRSTEGLSFVLLKDALAGSSISFDERNTDGSGGMTGGDGIVTITFTCHIPAGTVIAFEDSPSFVNGFTDGKIKKVGNFTLSVTTERIYAYIGEPSTTPSTFLAAASITNFPAAGTNSLTSTGLTAGTNAWEGNTIGTGSHDLWTYSGSISGQASYSAYLSLINNTSANWTTENGASTESNGTSPDYCGGGGACGGYIVPGNFSITTACSAPANQPTSLVLAPFITNIQGDFTAAASSPSGYLVVRYASGATATNPSNTTFYCEGDALGSGTVVQMSNALAFVAMGLTPSTTYDYYIYSYNSECSGQPSYNTTSPLSGSMSTKVSLTYIETNVGAFGTTAAAVDSANTLNDLWEIYQESLGIGCVSGGFSVVNGTMTYVGSTGTVSGLKTTNITSGSGTGNAYVGTVTFQLIEVDFNPDNPLIDPYIIQDTLTSSTTSVKTVTSGMQDNSPAPTGVTQYYTEVVGSGSFSDRNALELNMSVPVKTLGFFLGDVETTTTDLSPTKKSTPAVVLVFDSSGNEIERKIIPTASAGGNCSGTTTAGATGCGSGETVYVNIQSPDTNISKVVIVVGDYVDDPSLSPNAGGDRGNAEHLSFGGFTLGGDCTTPLPVELIHFSGIINKNGYARLLWQTASEIDNSHFEIQKADYNGVFKTVGTVIGNGNSNQTIEYEFTDNEVLVSVSNFRLKQVDFNGEFSYSRIITLNSENELKSRVTIFPNPAKNKIEFSGDVLEIKSVSIIDITGKELISTDTPWEGLSLNFKSGFYWVRIIDFNGIINQQRLIIEN